ncbi:MAG: hypothetical protein LBL58_10630 [Tannerellaceae bacterium]|jgi:mevalonate kinase|nr:hypothetical protein [Tannerellaceae bacterium]
MRIYGRITIYGEYLMHSNECGLIMPSNLYLETTEKKDYKSGYNKKLDRVLVLLKEKGIIPKHTLRGNLPLGYGLAGSTVLGFLHLSHFFNNTSKRNIINEIDTKIHGFTPSGLDFESCIHQQWGLFCSKFGWESQQTPSIDYSLIIFPKEQKMKLSKIQERVLSAKNLLAPIQKELNRIVKTHNVINLDLLMEYSQILSSIGVYSEVVNNFIYQSLENGFITKSIGGLYDKAVIIIFDNSNRENYSFIEKLVSLSSGKIL